MPQFPAYLHGFSFSRQVGEIRADSPAEVGPALDALERQVASGVHAAGFVCYEAAAGLDDALPVCAQHAMPLLWFGLYEERRSEPFPRHDAPFRCSGWTPSLGEEGYGSAVRTIRDLIAAGESYQVNFTLRQRFTFAGCPRSYFSELCRSQPTEYSCYLECDKWRILSASPELFFSLTGEKLVTRPMKGTAPRGRWWEEDVARREQLRRTPKETAENLMIVDLLRNDMGMVSQTGSVRVTSLFDVESHPTVHQMTSTIESRLQEGVTPRQLFRSLFPCGSVTGAPKRRSMEIIDRLEGEPRGLYTGSLGYFSPGGEAKFSVAIRTAVIDGETGCGEIGIGSGITWDSSAEAEYRECLDKGRFAQETRPEFHLIESILHEGGGYFLLKRHLERLESSAGYFSFPFDAAKAAGALKETAAALDSSRLYKVRLLLHAEGTMSCEAAEIRQSAAETKASFARRRVHSGDPFLYHKTSRRDLFQQELAEQGGVHEVIFLNERDEVTEGTYSNVVARIDGRNCTPPLSCGLLPGTMREELLARGDIEEKILKREDLERAEALYLVNSVRKWRKATLVLD